MGLFKQKERDLFSVRAPQNDDKVDKKRKKKRRIDDDEEDDFGSKKRARFDGLIPDDMQPLTYQSIAEGMAILGCVQEVRDYELIISLPHLLVGTVTLARISKAYTQLLSRVAESEGEVEEKVFTLKELYEPGQNVVTRVVSLEDVNNKIKVNLSLMPQEINFGISPSFLEAGNVIVCAVNSVEDNGYVMDTGIPNVRAAFLKNNNAEGSGIVGVGSVVRCVVTKIIRSDKEKSVRLQLSADGKGVNEATMDISDTTNLAILLPGTAINTTVSKIHRQGLKVLLADVDGVVSRLHLQTPFSQVNQYELAHRVRARVLYIMPLSKIVHLTLQPNVCAKRPEPDPLHGIKIGDIVKASEIYEAKRSGVFFKLGEHTRGFCSCNHLKDSGKEPRNLQKQFPVGMMKITRVIKYNYMDQLFVVSLQKSVIEQQIISYQGLKAGQIIKATINKFTQHGAEVAVSKFISGVIPHIHLTDSTMPDPRRKHNIGDTVKCRVLKVTPEQRHLLLTCKSQLVEYEGGIVDAFSPEVIGKETRGSVVKILRAGILISFYNDVNGFAPRSLTHAGETALGEVYEIGQVVDCTVNKVFPEKSSMIVSLILGKGKKGKKNKEEKNKKGKMEGEEKKEEVKKEGKKKNEKGKVEGENEMKEGKMEGEEKKEKGKNKKKIEEEKKIEGVEEEKEGKKGKKNKKEEEEKMEVEEEKEGKKGKKNKNKKKEEEEEKTKKKKGNKEEIEAVDEEKEETEKVGKKKKKKNKGEEITEEKEDKKRKNEKEEEEEGEEKKKKKKKKKKKGKTEEEEEEHEDSGVEVRGAEDEEPEKASEAKPKSPKRPKNLSSGTGFIWDVPETIEDAKIATSDEDSDTEDVGLKRKKRLTKAERVAAAKEEERRLHELECARLDESRNPQSSLDFEELLQRTPNSSTIWIQFISFHLENAEVEQGKAVARRALQVIDATEDDERLNIWTVLLRLEVNYGTEEDVTKTYMEAQSACDQLKVQMAMAMVYTEANKFDEAEKVYYVMSKKYSQVLDVWVKAGIYFFSHNKAAQGRDYMDRAIKSIDKRNHVELINRFAQLEFRFGEAERGRTMFESLLSNYPKRIDVWGVYVDLLTKHGDYDGARHILDRMTGLKLRLRKMRFIFKKFLEFEKEHGTSQNVEAVKKRVEEFVASTVIQDA